ncbi:molybdenum cofactor guanylyltransferase [Parafrankia sp. FMc2]|uniref:molybdenum cofactor guanylyltransferase n=1 Tax=Parafrankia sp. FMc2 TaxID=3233196 RepID=UPI003B589FE4
MSARPGVTRTGGGGAPWDAIVLAGGLARRMGGVDKATLEVDGARLLDRVLHAVEAARSTVVVGPPRPRPAGSRRVRWAREYPPGGGPVAAIAAGLRLVEAPVVVVLAVDLPFFGAAEVRGLLDRLDVHSAAVPAVPAVPDGAAADAAPVDVAVLSDPSGRPQYLAAAWRTAVLRAALPADPAGRSVRSLLAGRQVRAVPADARACLDCDDPEALAAARALPR